MSRVRFSDPAPYVGWVCCWFSTLLREVFLRVLLLNPLLKNQHFQIPIRSWNARIFLTEFLWTPCCSVGKQIKFTFFIFLFFLFLYRHQLEHGRIPQGLYYRPFNNTWILKFKAQPTNELSLPSIKCSAVPPSFRLLPSTVVPVQRFDYHTLVIERRSKRNIRRRQNPARLICTRLHERTCARF